MSKWARITATIKEEEKEEIIRFMHDYNEKKNKGHVLNSFVRAILLSAKNSFYKK